MKSLSVFTVLILSSLNAPRLCSEQKEWWQRSILYEVYPKSFKDSNGDGIGDLNGIIEKLEYLVDLGVESIWITPFYPHGGADEGYDITDFQNIDPQYGTMADFDRLLAEAHKRGIKVILDYVPNHTSDKHEWFQKSVEGIEPYTDYYVWAHGIGPNKTDPPNNWMSIFPGSAWEYNKKRGMLYYHAFTREQPDLNYRNVAVQRQMKDVMRFWLDKGIDGFRVDAVDYIYESTTLENETLVWKEDSQAFVNFRNLTEEQPKTFELLTTWRALLDDYTNKTGQTKIMVLESYFMTLDRMRNLHEYNGKKSSHYPFNMGLIFFNRNSNASQIDKIIHFWLDNNPVGGTLNWAFSNHDLQRLVDRVGKEISDAVHMLSLLLPGVCVSYQGEEIGMEGGLIRIDERRDVHNSHGPRNDDTRDPGRTPMQWNDSVNAGFSTAKRTWLPVASNYYHLNVAAQQKAEWSKLKIYQRLAEIRKLDTFVYGSTSTYVLNNERVLVVSRYLQGKDTYLVVINFNSFPEEVDLRTVENIADSLYVVVPSMNSGYRVGQRVIANPTTDPATKILLHPKASLVLIRPADGKPYVDPHPHNAASSIMSRVLAGVLSFLVICATR